MLSAIIATVTVLIGVFGVSSYFHHKKVETFLNKQLGFDESLRQKVAKDFGLTEGVATGVSVFDVLYHTSRMNPFALAGINHLHHAQNFDSLGDLIAFMKLNIIHSEPGQAAWRDMVHKYKGYTGEEMGINHLQHSGHTVQVPESGTQAGHDVIAHGSAFDGPVNIKVTDSPAYIAHHLSQYPNIPVLTNNEMSSAFSDNPNVTIDPHLSSQECFHTTSNTLGGISDLGSFMDHIPLITLTISSIRNVSGVVAGRKSLADGLEHTLEDTAAVGFGSYAGGHAGLALGLALAPATGGASAIIIPVATTLIGSVIGIFTGKGIVGWFKHRHLRKAVEELKNASASFYRSFMQQYDAIIQAMKGPYSLMIEKYRFAFRQSENWFKRTFYPSVISKFYLLAPTRVREEVQQHNTFYEQLKQAVQQKEASEAGLIIYAQGINILCGVSPLPDQWRLVEEKGSAVEHEKARIS